MEEEARLGHGILDSFSVIVLAEDSVGYESPLLGQHGISFLADAQAGQRRMRVLVDVGQNPQALLFNMKTLDIDPGSIDAIFITHCHYDHTGGLARIVAAIGKPDLPVFAHPALFRPNFIDTPQGRLEVGVRPEDSQEVLKALGVRLVLSDEPIVLMPGLYSSGYVPRLSNFESRGSALKTLDDLGNPVFDPMEDDISLVAAAPRGIVVLTGCSHAGIANIIMRAKKLAAEAGGGEPRIEAALGGLHLIESDNATIEKTTLALRDLVEGIVAAGHCTGFEAQIALRGALGDRFKPLRTGMRFNF
jgi:7,8-dihydropterin-6-yl-methyl-4-(beta-D-ribofuranosyl)aminobenzene 5'-phosphate synthase